MRSIIGETSESRTSGGKPWFSVQVSHPGLGKSFPVEDSDKDAVEAAARELAAQWDLEYAARLRERENQRKSQFKPFMDRSEGLER